MLRCLLPGLAHVVRRGGRRLASARCRGPATVRALPLRTSHQRMHGFGKTLQWMLRERDIGYHQMKIHKPKQRFRNFKLLTKILIHKGLDEAHKGGERAS